MSDAANLPAEPFRRHLRPTCMLLVAKGPEDLALESAPAVSKCPSSGAFS